MKSFLYILLTAYCLLHTCVYAQTSGYHINVEKASTTYLQWKVAGDFTGYDSLHFVVKPCTTSGSCNQLIKRNCSETFSNPYTTVKCTLYVEDTQGFNAAKYFYSVYAYGGDTVAVRSGNFNLQLNGQTPVDGVATSEVIYTIALDQPDYSPSFLIGDSTDNSWTDTSLTGVQTILGVSTPVKNAIEDSLDRIDTELADITDEMRPANTLYVGSDQVYTTISSAITAASSGDMVVVFPATYDEAITVNKNLTFVLDGVIITNTAASTASTVVVNSGITTKFIGGEIKRDCQTSTSKVISSSGNLILDGVTLTHTGNVTYLFFLNLTEGTIDADNVTESNPYNNGYNLFNSVTGHINFNTFLGKINIDSSQVNITAEQWYSKIHFAETHIITGNSDVNISVKYRWGRLPGSGNLDSLYFDKAILISEGVTLTIRDGIIGSQIGATGNHTVNLINVNNEYGLPGIIYGNNGTNPTAYWNISNSKLTYTPQPFLDTTFYGGVHIFEANAATNDTMTVYLTIDNSSFYFGDKAVYDGTEDTCRVSGNIFAMGWKGKINANSSTFVQYPETNTGVTAYDFFGSINKTDVEFNNCFFDNYSQEKTIWMVSLPVANYVKAKFFNNTFIQRNENITFNEIFFINDLRDFSVNDTIIIEGSIVSVANNRVIPSNGLIRVNGGIADLKTLYENQYVYRRGVDVNRTVSNQLYTKGFTYYSLPQENVLTSSGFQLIASDTLSRMGVDGDSLRVTIYPKYPMTIGVQAYGYNKTDISMTLYANKYSSNGYSTNTFWDVRMAWVARAKTINRHVYFNATEIMEHETEPCTLAVAYDNAGTDGTTFQYISFIVVNKNTGFPIELAGYIRQSLNFGNLVLTRF